MCLPGQVDMYLYAVSSLTIASNLSNEFVDICSGDEKLLVYIKCHLV